MLNTFVKRKVLGLHHCAQHVLQLVWESQKPVGAYDLMELLEQNSQREKVAPPTIYRALDFLMEHGLIRKIHSQNSFVSSYNPLDKHGHVTFICEGCGKTTEVHNSTIQQSINLNASQNRFTVSEQILEIKGFCKDCRPTQAARKSGQV